MHDLNLNLFYRTTFDISGKDENTYLLASVVNSIRYWLTGKWNRNETIIPDDKETWDKFRNKHSFTSLDRDKSVRLNSHVYWQGKETYWSCIINEVSRENGKAPRHWITEIGFAQNEEAKASNKAKITIVLSYGDQPGFLGELQERPKLTIPRLIHTIASNKFLDCTIFGFPIESKPILLNEGDFEAFWSIVSDPNRDVPVVFISPNATRLDNTPLSVDPEQLHYALGPSAIIYYAISQGFCDEMDRKLPDYDFRCRNGAVRIYDSKPNMSSNSDQYRHRYFSYEAVEVMGSDNFIAMLRRALAQDVRFYEQMTRVDDVASKVRRASREKQLREEADSNLDLADSYSDDLSNAEKEIDRLKKQNAELEDDNRTLYTKAANLEASLNTIKANSNYAPAEFELEQWPLNARQIADIFHSRYPDRIDFTDRALKTLDKCKTQAETLWNAFYDLCEIAYGLYSSQTSVDIASEFNGRSNFLLARCAGMMTRKDNSLMEQYNDIYHDREINVETHLKKGKKEADAKFLRLYFGYDSESGKLIVSSVGKHLDNYSTRFLS